MQRIIKTFELRSEFHRASEIAAEITEGIIDDKFVDCYWYRVFNNPTNVCDILNDGYFMTVLYSCSNDPIAFMIINDISSFIELIIVSEKQQGQGLGSKLIKEAISFSSERLYLDVHPDNHGAIRLYKKLGFTMYDARGPYIRMIQKKHV